MKWLPHCCFVIQDTRSTLSFFNPHPVAEQALMKIEVEVEGPKILCSSLDSIIISLQLHFYLLQLEISTSV